MRPKGYNPLTVQKIGDANPFLLGVQFAKVCVAKNIPIVDVAEYLGISTSKVRDWFFGIREVSDEYAERVEDMLRKLS